MTIMTTAIITMTTTTIIIMKLTGIAMGMA